jgi:UPF0148 protein
MNQKETVTKKMAELLKAGNVMLNDFCPDCKVPLFKLKDGKIICPSCNRTVIYVKYGEEEIAKHYQTIDITMNSVIKKITELTYSIIDEIDEKKLKLKISLINDLLDAYDKLLKIKKHHSEA